MLDDSLQAGTISYTLFIYEINTKKKQRQPMDLFLKISVLQANVCWLGDVEKIICPWKGIVVGKKII